MNVQPEVAVVTSLGPDHPLIQSLVAQLLEHGVHFTRGENQSLLSELPEDLSPYKTVLLDPPALDRALADPDSRKHLEAYAAHENGGMVFPIEDPLPDRSIRGLNANMLYDLVTSHRVFDAILHANLTVNHPALWEAMEARPTVEILEELHQTILKRLNSDQPWSEFLLHNYKAALALIEIEFEDIREALIDSIKRVCQRPHSPVHHDLLAGYFATVWYAEQTGDDSLMLDIKAKVDEMFRRRPREMGMIAGCGYEDDPLGLNVGEGPLANRMSADSTMRRKVIWTEVLHFHGPTLASLTRATGDRKYLDELMKLIEYTDRHHVREDDLLAHTTREGAAVTGAWARGQTHALLGLLYTLEELDRNAPEFETILQLLDRVGRGLMRYQDEATGLWRNLLDNPSARVESSGTTGIACVYGRCIEEGWLDRQTYEPMVHRALCGIKRLYWRGGLCAGCRGTGAGYADSYYIARPQGYASIPQQTMAVCLMQKFGI